MNLGVTVVASCYHVSCPGSLNLFVLDFSILKTFFFKAGLEITTSAAAAEVIAFVRIGVNKIFFANTRLDYKAQIICCCVAKAFSDDVAWVLNGEF